MPQQQIEKVYLVIYKNIANTQSRPSGYTSTRTAVRRVLEIRYEKSGAGTGMNDPYIETTGSYLDQPITRIRRTSVDSDLIICERVGDNITYCRDRYPLNVRVDDYFDNVPWFICQPGFDIDIDFRAKR